jgi:superfamily II DNA or RNA helicase
MNKDWFNIRNLKILNYQNIAIDKTNESLIVNEKTVLAACPSSGKTTITIYIIEQYLKLFPTNKVTILTHGTTILRSQFHDELLSLKPNFTFDLVETYSDYVKSNADVVVCLPQTLNNQNIKPNDLIIVDEAHHFYFAKMVQDIITKSNSTKQLLLTGTPSKFIYENLKEDNKFNIIPVSIETIFDEGMATNATVEVASSIYDFDLINDFNSNNLKKDVVFNDIDTNKSLDDLLEKIVNRLRSYKNSPYINFIPTWNLLLKDLEKTMFACQSINQAKQVYKYFKSKNINCVISTSEDDLESNEITRFKTDDNILVLIVVYRGILGFNYPKLANVVDMTMSYNIDRVFQLFARILRINKDNPKQQKLFFKLSPSMLTDYYKHIMNAMLMLMNDEYFLKYNGKNFLDMDVPVKKININSETITDQTDQKSDQTKKQKKYIPINLDGVPVFDFFKNIWHKKDNVLNTYCLTTVNDVKSEFTKIKPSNYWTYEKCQEAALLCKSRTEFCKKFNTAYKTSSNNNWLDEICSHMIDVIKPSGYWTEEICQETALLCKTKTEFKNNFGAAYNAARKLNFLDKICSHMIDVIKPSGYWTEEICQDFALLCNSRTQFSIKYPGAYQSAQRNNFLDKICSHMTDGIKPSGYWTEEICQDFALLCNSRNEFRKKYPNAYNAARKLNFLDKVCSHMTDGNKPSSYWTEEICQDFALLCKNKTEFLKKYPNAYNAARKLNCLNKVCSHMNRFLKLQVI